MQVEPKEKRQLMTRPAYRFSILPTLTALPSWKLRAILHINSRIKLADIEKYFIFGEGDLHDRLLKSFNKYFSLQGDALKTVDEKIAKILQEKVPQIPNTSKWDDPDRVKAHKELTKRASQLKLKAVEYIANKSLVSKSYKSDKTNTEIDYSHSEKKLLENELYSYLRVSITKKLDFLHEYMLKECVYEMDGNREDTRFIPFDCDLKSYTKKYFFPLSKDSEQDAEKKFETFLKSLVYKKMCANNLQNADKSRLLTVADLDSYENLKELRIFCQSLLRFYSKDILYGELREKGCDPITATRIVYKHTQKDKGPKKFEKSDDPKNFGYEESRLRVEASRFDTRYVKNTPHSSTNIIAILGDDTQS